MSRINELFDLLSKNRSKGLPSRLLLFEENRLLRVYNGNIEITASSYENANPAPALSLDRGKIIEIFSKLEFLINEIIQIHLIGWNNTNNLDLDALLDKISFEDKIHFLYKRGLIDKETSKYLDKLRPVRNKLAHVWGIEDIKYGEKSLKDNFIIFKSNLEELWNKLINSYNNILTVNSDILIKDMKHLWSLSPEELNNSESKTEL